MLTVDETAAFIWRLLETQGKHGCPWEIFKEVPDELKQIVPVERRAHYVRKQDTVVLSTYREYTESAARRCLSSIGFDIVSSLRTWGYKRAFYGFRQAVRAYAQQQRLSRYYAR